MTKYHINSRGVPSICRAKISCPLGASYDGRAEAKEAAEKERDDFMQSQKNYSNKAERAFLENLDNKEFSKIEAEMNSHNAETLEKVYSQIQEERNKPGSLSEKRNQTTESSNEVFKKKQKRAEEIKSTMKEDLIKVEEKEKEVERLKDIVKKQEEAVKNHNEGSCPKCGKGNMVKRDGKFGQFLACNNYPACKHTDKPVAVNPLTKKKLEKAEHDVKIEEQKLKDKVRKAQKEDPESISLENKLEEYRKKIAILQYIDSHENPRGYASTNRSEITPIEQYYEKRKIGDKKIEKKLGVARVAIDSKNLSFGTNEIKEKLTVDSKGRINNLYMEDPNNLGEVKRVIKINEDSSKNIEFEDGSSITISNSTNYKTDGLAKVPSGIKFYTTNSKSKKEYSGYKKLIVNNFDSGD